MEHDTNFFRGLFGLSGLFGLFFLSGCQIFSGASTADYDPNLVLAPKVWETRVSAEYKSEYKKTASILHFGDVMLDRNVKKRIEENGPDYLLEKLAGVLLFPREDPASDTVFISESASSTPLLFAADVIGANLEGPFADKRRPTSKSIAFRFDPGLLPMLKKYGFGFFSLANNHTMDMGSAGFAETKKNLAAAGFNYYGSQHQINDESVLLKRVGDFDIAFVGINDTNAPVNIEKVKTLIKKTKMATPPRPLPVSSTGQALERGGHIVSPPYQGGDKEGVAAVIAVDFLIVNIHWGEEYKEISNARQRKLARAMIDAGADVIIGHHPHVVQEMEIYQDRPIFYSLGNFIFDQYFSEPTQQGLAVGLVFNEPPPFKEGAGGGQKSIFISIFPLQGVQSQVSQMDYDKSVPYFDKWIAKSRLGDYEFENFNLVISL